MKKLIFTFTLLTVAFIAYSQQPTDVTVSCCGDYLMFNKCNSLEIALANKDTVTALDLSMREVKLTSVPKEVVQLPNLVCLDVSFNRISTIPVEIKQMKKLRCIDLSGNHYLQTLPDFFNEMESLQVVRLVDMKLWNVAKKEALKKKFPKLQLVFE